MHLRQRLPVAHRQIADHVTETEDQTAADQRRQQREEDLGKMRDQLLVPLHILPRRLLGLFLIGRRFAGGRQQGFVVIADFCADHDLELPGVGKAAFHHAQLLNFFRFGDGRIVQHKA